MRALFLALLDIVLAAVVLGFVVGLLWDSAAPWADPAPAASGVHNLNLQVPARRDGVVGLI